MHVKMGVMYYIIDIVWLQAMVHLHVRNTRIVQSIIVILKTFIDVHGVVT